MGLGWAYWLGEVQGRILRFCLSGLADPFSVVDRVFTEEQEGEVPAVRVPIG